MISGSVSKITEGNVEAGKIIVIQNDLVYVSGNAVIQTIRPGLGTAQGQLLMLVSREGPLILGNQGNIMGEAVIPPDVVCTLIYSKAFQKWILPFIPGRLDEGDEEMAYLVNVPFNASDFVTIQTQSGAPGSTWTVAPLGFQYYFYYISGKRVTVCCSAVNTAINPVNDVIRVGVKLPDEIADLAGPYKVAAFIGSAVLLPSFTVGDASLRLPPGYCGVTFREGPFPHIQIMPNSGNFAGGATPFSFWASVTYIIN